MKEAVLFFWFVGMSVVGVFFVFRSSGVDYRFVIFGAVLPVGEVFIGHPTVLHTLLGAVVLLGFTMLATRGHRVARRRLLGLPIGLFAHLVLDFVWTQSALFWWPFLGWSFGRRQIPEFARGAAGVALELAGIVALAWSWRRFGLADVERRRRFLTSGHLDLR